MKTSFIIPNYNGREILEMCLKSLRRFHPNEKVFIVDDCSEPENQDYAKNLAEKYNCYFSVNKENSGFSKTINVGLRHPENDADISILTNSDIEFIQNVSDEFKITFEEKPQVGIVGGLLLYPERFPGDKMIQHAGVFRFKHGNSFAWAHKHWYKQLDQCFDAAISEYSMSVTGALYGIRMNMTESVGFFDERFFLAFEDTEYSLRAWQRGWHVYYNANIIARHHEGFTRGRSPKDKMEKNPIGFEKEKKGQGIFEAECKNINFVEIIKNLNELNAESKLKRLDILNEMEGYLCLARKGALGDVILLTPIIQKIKKLYPKIKVNVLTDYPEIFENNPYVENSDKRNVKYDIIINLDMSYEIEPKLSVIEAYSRRVFGKNIDMVKPKLYYKEFNVLGMLPYIAINMSKSWPSRTWPTEYWRQVIDYILMRGFRVYCIGTDKDIEPPKHEDVIDLRGKTTIRKCYNIIKHSKLFIGMDSGLLHLANCAEIPTIGIFTSVDPDLRIPKNTKNCTVIIPDTNCRFCLHEQSAPVTFLECKEINKNVCARNIKPESVKLAIIAKLGGNK